MLIDEIDFSALYQQQLALAQRTEKHQNIGISALRKWP